jgi:hypothetical protein
MELLNQRKHNIPKGWITFIPNKTSDFSESFKARMEEDLYPQIYSLLDNKILEEEFGFSLTVGRVNLKMTEKDNYVFIIAELSVPFATMYSLTVGWTSPDFKNPMEIHRSDINNKNVQFTWCTDFPKNEIIKELTPMKVVEKSDSGLKFDVVYFLKTFPDVAIYFDFIGVPTDSTLKALDYEVKDFKDTFKTIFTMEIRKYGNDYIIPFDYNTIDIMNYSEKDFQKDLIDLEVLLSNINKNVAIRNLKRIRFY